MKRRKVLALAAVLRARSGVTQKPSQPTLIQRRAEVIRLVQPQQVQPERFPATRKPESLKGSSGELLERIASVEGGLELLRGDLGEHDQRLIELREIAPIAAKAIERADTALSESARALARGISQPLPDFVVDVVLVNDQIIAVYHSGDRKVVGNIGKRQRQFGGGRASSLQQLAGTVTVIEKSANFTVPSGAGRYVVLADASAGPITITLPTATGRPVEQDVTVIRKNVGGSNVTVMGAAGQPICGDTGGLVLNSARTGNTAAAEFTPILGGWWIT